MTGSALTRYECAGSCILRRSQKNIFRKGRGLGRGGLFVGPGWRVADDGKRLDEVRVALGVV